MKPDTGFEMEEEPYDPRELFADIALLITEARTPDLSKKGRVEGPHCPPVQGSREHDCDRHKEQCRKASDILTQHKILLRNNIPMRIDVLLFPPCEHGLREETVVVGAMFSTVDTFILLERWDIQLINKRSSEKHDGYVSGRSLLQAVRSYLHFSQLSSWLISTGGAMPLRAVYRVYAPGEAVGYTFEKLPEVHNFPPADLGEAMMRATVAHLGRQEKMMLLCCSSPSTNVEQHGRLRKTLPEEKYSQGSLDSKTQRGSPDLKGPIESILSSSACDDDYFGYSPPGASNRRHSKDHMEYGKSLENENYDKSKSVQLISKPPSGKKISDIKLKEKEKNLSFSSKTDKDTVGHMQSFKMDELSLALQESEIRTVGGHRKDPHDSCLATRLPSNHHTKLPVIPPSSLPIKKSVPEVRVAKLPGQMSPQKSHPYKKPSTLFSMSTNPSSFHITKRLPSPKVLMTASKKPQPSGYTKRCLDYDEDKLLPETSDPFSTLQQLDELTSTDMQALVRPLSPNQLDAYLSSLSSKLPKKTSVSQLDEIPLTKCRFFIGESDKSDEVFESPLEQIADNKKEMTHNQHDLALQCTAHSLSQTITAGADNSNNSSLSTECTGTSDHPCLSEINLFKTDTSENKTESEWKLELSQDSSFGEENQNNSSMMKEVETQVFDVDSTPEPHKPVYFPNRRLFHKSSSTSEVEDDFTGKKSLKKVINKLKTESKESVGYWENVQKGSEESKDQLQEEKPVFVKSNETSETNPVSSAESVKVEKSTYAKQDNQNSVTVSDPVRKSTRHNLDDISIPCSIGSEKTEVSDSIGGAKSIEICANQTRNLSHNKNSSCSSLSGSPESSSINGSLSPTTGSYSYDSEGSPTPVSGSPNVDNEVKHHFKQSLSQSSQRQTSLKRGSSSDLPDVGLSLCKQLLRKGFQQCVENEVRSPGKQDYKNLPSPDDIQRYQFNMARSASALFNSNTGLPTRSSPAPIKRKSSGCFDYDSTLTNVRAIKNAVSCSRLSLQYENKENTVEDLKIISTSAPASTNCLLGNFEESMLNGRLEPVGVVDGFTAEIGAGGAFCPKHITLPVAAYFFQLSDDNAPSPYLGHVNLDALGKRGYHIPRTGTVQVTLFNPNKTVVKMFVVMYDLSDMPASCQTFLRQRTMYMPVDKKSTEPSFLRYLIHLRFASTKSGKIYLHTDIRLIFARDKFEFDPRVANYELRSFTEGPENPKFSPKR